MAETPASVVAPSGIPVIARTWFSNWLVSAPSIVQWPELWTRGRDLVREQLVRPTSNSSIASTPT